MPHASLPPTFVAYLSERSVKPYIPPLQCLQITSDSSMVSNAIWQDAMRWPLEVIDKDHILSATESQS